MESNVGRHTDPGRTDSGVFAREVSATALSYRLDTIPLPVPVLSRPPSSGPVPSSAIHHDRRRLKSFRPAILYIHFSISRMNLCSREEAEILPFHGYEKEEMIRDRGKKEIKKKRNLEERTQRKYDRVYGSREVRRCRTRIRERRGGRKRRRNPSGGMECAFENPSTVFLPTLTYAPVRTRIGEKRSGAGGETRLALLVSQDYALSLSLTVFDAFSEHNKQTPPRNLFSYVRGHLPVYASFSTFSLARSFFFSFLLSFFSSSPFRIPSLSHLRQWPVYEPGRVRSLSLRPDRTGNVHLSSSYIRRRGAETKGRKNFGNFFHRHVFVQELTNHLLTNPRQGCDRAFQKERNWTNVSSGIV